VTEFRIVDLTRRCKPLVS